MVSSKDRDNKNTSNSNFSHLRNSPNTVALILDISDFLPQELPIVYKTKNNFLKQQNSQDSLDSSSNRSITGKNNSNSSNSNPSISRISNPANQLTSNLQNYNNSANNSTQSTSVNQINNLPVEKLCELVPDEYKLSWLKKLSVAKQIKDEIKRAIGNLNHHSNGKHNNFITQNIQFCFQNWLEDSGYKEELDRLSGVTGRV